MPTVSLLAALVVLQTPADTAMPLDTIRGANCEPTRTLTLITGPVDGPYHRAGRAIAQIIANTADCFAVRVLTSSGSVENMDWLASEKAHLAIVQGDIAHYASRSDDSLEMFAENLRDERNAVYTTTKLREVRAIMGLHTEQLLIIARAALGLTDALDITRDHRIVVGTEGSGTLPNAKGVLEALGHDFNSLASTINAPPRDFLPLLPDTIDVVFLTAGASQEFLDSLSGANAQLLPLTDDAARSLDSLFRYYDAIDVQFDGRAIRTLEIKAVLAAGPALDSLSFGSEVKTIKTITDSLAENLIGIQRVHPRFRAIRASTMTTNIPIALHRGARAAYCDRGLLSCAIGWTWLVVATVLLTAYLSVMSVRTRTVMVQFVPRATSFLVGPFGTTRAYRYILIPAAQIFFLVLGVVAIRALETGYAETSNIPNPFSNMSVWQNLGWGFTVATTGHNGGLFPTGQFAIFIAATLQIVGRGGVLLLIGAYASDRLARILKMGRDLKTLRDHTIICHWNGEAAGVVRALTNPALKGRRQVVVVLADRKSDPTERLSDVSSEHVSFIRGQPSNTADLMKAGLASAYQVMILADDKFPDPDARTVLAVLSIESLSLRFQETKERTTNIRTMAQMVDPANRPALVTANVDEIICGARFDERLLVQSTLNPGLSRFLDEILEVGDFNEIYEVPVREDRAGRKRKEIQIVGRTFDEVLIDCRKKGALLLAVDPGGAPNVVASNGDETSAHPRRRTSASLRPVSIDGLELPSAQATGRGSRKLRPMLTNPSLPHEVDRRIKVGDSLLFLAESEKPLEQIFGSSKDWLTAFKED